MAITIPTYITVHLGAPNAAAQNEVVPFPEYLKRCASAEVYPTWPREALRANIYAITSFALNRIYTEYYRSRGYNFDITNNTAFDQAYPPGGNIYGTISDLVDEQFNDYIVRGQQVQPLFAAYCSGDSVTCDGLSQWGTVYLSNQGYSALRILRYYYGNDVNIVYNAPVQGIQQSYPGRPLQLGSIGEEVRVLQRELNRIAINYPAIPRVAVNNGIFNAATRNAVIAFQQIFNLDVDGVVGKATWYKVKQIYNGVKNLSEIYSEGLSLNEVDQIYATTLRRGDRGNQVRYVQFYLNFIGQFYDDIPVIAYDGIFGPATQAAVLAFQRRFGLTPDGIVGRNTWNALQNVYEDVLNSLPNEFQEDYSLTYPGYVVTTGMRGPVVRRLQTFLRTISENDYRVPSVKVDGVYGNQTAAAVRAIQNLNGLPESGETGALTWSAIVEMYDEYR